MIFVAQYSNDKGRTWFDIPEKSWKRPEYSDPELFAKNWFNDSKWVNITGVSIRVIQRLEENAVFSSLTA